MTMEAVRVEKVDEGMAPLERTEPAAPAKPLRGEAVSAVLTNDERVSVTARVREADGSEAEYVASVSLGVLMRLAPEEQRRAMAEAVRLERDRMRRLRAVDLDGLLGEFEIG